MNQRVFKISFLLVVRPLKCMGFTPFISKEEVLHSGIREYIEKPVGMKNLAVLIRKILDKKQVKNPGCSSNYIYL